MQNGKTRIEREGTIVEVARQANTVGGGRPPNRKEVSMNTTLNDAKDCARHLVETRDRKSWERFDFGVQEFLLKRRERLLSTSLRIHLAEAYANAEPADQQGQDRIMQCDTK